MFRIKEVEDKLRISARGQENFLRGHNIDEMDTLGKDYKELVFYNLDTSGAVLTVNNEIEIFTDGMAKFERCV